MPAKESILAEPRTIEPFIFKAGYTFTVEDIGDEGIIISMRDQREDSATIILPVAEAEKLTVWLADSLGQTRQVLPSGLAGAIEKLLGGTAKTGDKKLIKQCVTILKKRRISNENLHASQDTKGGDAVVSR